MFELVRELCMQLADNVAGNAWLQISLPAGRIIEKKGSIHLALNLNIPFWVLFFRKMLQGKI